MRRRRFSTLLLASALPLCLSAVATAGTEAATLLPRGARSLPPPLRAKLESSWALAHERLRESPSCRDLYLRRRQTGSESLTRTLYVQPKVAEAHSICRRKVVAFTVVGSSATRLCSSFARLATPRAAADLLHEALHSAGMPEAPQVRGALTASEIDELVSRRCDL